MSICGSAMEDYERRYALLQTETKATNKNPKHAVCFLLIQKKSLFPKKATLVSGDLNAHLEITPCTNVSSH